ncbi:ABC transporter ATP-binding protein [Mycoplasma sp. P36-A1]|uniref:ABC transporter ATP-binding protein n=1 Tax=Mycoplasma sp. P36-A1 TaxID=3252900 RepID=UPI003C2D610E
MIKIVKTLLKSLKEYKKDAIIGPILVTIETVMEVLIPFLMTFILDKGLMQKDMNAVIYYGALAVLASIAYFVFGAIAGRYTAKAAAGLSKNIRHDMFENIQDYSFSNIDKFHSSSLITRMSTDVTNVQNAFHQCLRILVKGPLMMIFALIMAFSINPSLALIYLANVPIIGLALYLITHFAHPIFEKVMQSYDGLNEMVQENVAGIRVVKSYVREDQQISLFHKLSANIFRLFTKAEKIVALNGPLMQLAMYSTILLISWFGAHQIVNSQLQIGQLSTMITYAIQILIALTMLSFGYVLLLIASKSAVRIVEVLDEKSDLTNQENPLTEVKDGSIKFDNVAFSYINDINKCALKPTNFTINSGETVGILGETGSGKSTLVSLIPRLYDATSGIVSVGGHNVKEYDLHSLRAKVAMVLQKNVLFSGTIAQNLRWGNEHATMEQIIEACKIAQADEFVSKMPDGYDTYIEQGGSNVSGGQKQRLCIARALLMDPKILIFDDSTSAVDTKTDTLIRQAFKTKIPDVTKIIIAQRISSIEDADKIIIMKNGSIDAIGTHETLLDSNEIYSQTYYTQTRGGQDNE